MITLHPKNYQLKKLEAKKNLNDYNYFVGSDTQTSDYESTTECIINCIKRFSST
jgi:hypothetical protein